MARTLTEPFTSTLLGKFRFPELSVVVSVGNETRSIVRSRAGVGGYPVWAEHGFLREVPGQKRVHGAFGSLSS
jgi:hypothetical protein